MVREFNIDETDWSIGPAEKAEACYKAAKESLRAGARPAAEKLLVRGMQLYDLAGRPDMVLECARLMGQADPEKHKGLYMQAAEYFFEQGDVRKASEMVREFGLVELLDRYEEQYLID